MENKKIIVLGIGGGGMNVIDYMSKNCPEDVEFISVHSEKALIENAKTKKLLIGEAVTHGFGSGGNPERAKTAARMDKEEIENVIKDADLLFLIACLGGGTGTGASVIIGEIAKELGIKTFAIVTYPFSFEGKKRSLQAVRGYSELVPVVDEVVVLHNDEMLKNLERSASLADAFKAADVVVNNEFLTICRNKLKESD